MTVLILPSEPSHLALIPFHAKQLFLPIIQQRVGIRFTKNLYLDAGTALQVETKCIIKEREFCALLDRSGKPTVIESRKVNCRRPVMAVTEMTDCGRWVCFGPQRQGFSFDPRTWQNIDFTLTPGGWDLTMTLETPERANKVLNKAILEIRCEEKCQ